MPRCFFVSDLHGSLDRYRKLFFAIGDEQPDAVFFGGDLLPSGLLLLNQPVDEEYDDFISDFFVPELKKLKNALGTSYPRLFVIMGNDDFRSEEENLINKSDAGIFEYIHNRRVEFHNYSIYGYSHVPPTPFHFKDWERYDVSRYVDPGCTSPEDGARSQPISKSKVRYTTIMDDIDKLTGEDDLSQSIFLFHTPPYQTNLDRAALDGKIVDHVPMDVNVGSIAVARFIESRQPLVTLHGHIHESARLTGNWRDTIGRTHIFSAAHDDPRLALIRFALEDLSAASRELI